MSIFVPVCEQRVLEVKINFSIFETLFAQVDGKAFGSDIILFSGFPLKLLIFSSFWYIVFVFPLFSLLSCFISVYLLAFIVKEEILFWTMLLLLIVIFNTHLLLMIESFSFLEGTS